MSSIGRPCDETDFFGGSARENAVVQGQMGSQDISSFAQA